MFQCFLGAGFPHQGKATADGKRGCLSLPVKIKPWNIWIMEEMVFLSNRQSEFLPRARQKGSQWEMERELWSVSTLTGVTFLFLLVWQKPIVSGFSHWLMDIVPIKVRKLDIYISQNCWKTFTVTGCQMCPFSHQDRIKMRITLSVSELFTLCSKITLVNWVLAGKCYQIVNSSGKLNTLSPLLTFRLLELVQGGTNTHTDCCIWYNRVCETLSLSAWGHRTRWSGKAKDS